MSASHGTARYPGSTTFPGIDQYPGQGDHPVLVARLSFSDAAAYPTVWTDISSMVRAFQTDRGRESEQQQFDAGTATVVASNSGRFFDPTANKQVRPMNQLWIQQQFSGETNDVFKGWVESYDQEWPAVGRDATCTITAADEFKNLALDALPVMNPPSDTYEALVMSDEPDGYWRMNDPVDTFQVAATTGDTLGIAGAITPYGDTAILGDNGGSTGVGSYECPIGSRIEGNSADEGSAGDVSGIAEMTIEMWVRASAKPISTDYLCLGPTDGTEEMYRLAFLSTGQFDMFFRDAFGETNEVSAAPAGGFFADAWYHVVMTIEGGYARLYVNATQIASFNWQAPFGTIDTTSHSFRINELSNSARWRYDEVALYRRGLSSDRIAAHYQAGIARGFAANQMPGDRINHILDSIGSHAPRFIQQGSRQLLSGGTMRGVFMKGQDPLTEMRNAEQAELPEGSLFISAGGTVTFLDNNHQGESPWDTVQVIYGDGAGTIPGQRPYVDVDFDYSEAFLTNEWNLTREGGLLQTASDQGSIDRYGKRSQSITDMKLVVDTTVAEIAAELVGKYKTPQLRVLSLEVVTADPDLTLETFRLELEDRIRLIRTVSGGYIDRQLFVEKISVTGTPDGLWRVRLGVTDAGFMFLPARDAHADFDTLTAAYADFDALQNTEH